MISQFIRFLMVGTFLAIIDFGILNILIYLFGIGSHGQFFPWFKGISFLVATINSYMLNKYFTFRHGGSVSAKEALTFVVVSLIGMTINVSVAASAFNSMSGKIDAHFAANIAAAIGTLGSLLWNFSAYKFIVFRKSVVVEEYIDILPKNGQF
jgi:putative flippase GtrA